LEIYKLIERSVVGNDMIGLSPKNLQKTWQKFQSVSHLWAAFIYFGKWPDNAVEIVEFVSIAEFLRKWGQAYTPYRAANPFLDSRVMWKMPHNSRLFDVEVDLSKMEVSDWLIELVEVGVSRD
jgi:hypothetical protein